MDKRVLCLIDRSVTGWGCDYSPHRRAFVRLSLQEIREHVMFKWEIQQPVTARLVQLTLTLSGERGS